MKVFLVGVGDCESNQVICVCSTIEIAERKLFEERDKLIEEWKKMDEFSNKQIEEFCKKDNKPIWVDNDYKNMIKNISSNDYKDWDNGIHECPYISEIEVIDI